jgi:hypothetical protein
VNRRPSSGSRPQVAPIPYEESAHFLAWKEQEVLGEFDRVMARLAEQNAVYGDDEVAADVEAAISQVRAAPTKR